MDFFEIWHGDGEWKSKLGSRARFSILDFDFDFKAFKCRKRPFFVLFGNYLKNGSTVFFNFLICCSPNCRSPSEKNCMSRKSPVQKLLSPEKSKSSWKTVLSSRRFSEVIRSFPRKWISFRSIQNSLNYNHTKFQVDLIIIQCTTTGQSWPKSQKTEKLNMTYVSSFCRWRIDRNSFALEYFVDLMLFYLLKKTACPKRLRLER